MNSTLPAWFDATWQGLVKRVMEKVVQELRATTDVEFTFSPQYDVDDSNMGGQIAYVVFTDYISVDGIEPHEMTLRIMIKRQEEFIFDDPNEPAVLEIGGVKYLITPRPNTDSRLPMIQAVRRVQ